MRSLTVRGSYPSIVAPGDIGADGFFPHLYNTGQLGSQEVEKVFTLERKIEDSWDAKKLEDCSWLIY